MVPDRLNNYFTGNAPAEGYPGISGQIPDQKRSSHRRFAVQYQKVATVKTESQQAAVQSRASFYLHDSEYFTLGDLSQKTGLAQLGQFGIFRVIFMKHL
jgi:hypothetical protein